MENIFTKNIKSILEKHYKKNADEIFEKSQLIQYINEKHALPTEVQNPVRVLQICMPSMLL